MSTIRELRRQVQEVVADFSTRRVLIVENHGGKLIERSTGMVVPVSVARGGTVRTVCLNRGLIAAPPLQCHSGPSLKIAEPPPEGSLARLWCLAGGMACPRHENGFRALPWCPGSAYFAWAAFTAMESKDRWIREAGKIWSFSIHMQDLHWQAEQRRSADHLAGWQQRYAGGLKAGPPALASAEVPELPGQSYAIGQADSQWSAPGGLMHPEVQALRRRAKERAALGLDVWRDRFKPPASAQRMKSAHFEQS